MTISKKVSRKPAKKASGPISEAPKTVPKQIETEPSVKVGTLTTEQAEELFKKLSDATDEILLKIRQFASRRFSDWPSTPWPYHNGSAMPFNSSIFTWRPFYD